MGLSLSPSFRRISIGLLALLSLVTVGGALAWACTFSATITLSPPAGAGSGTIASGPVGTAVEVSGRSFLPNRPVEIHWNEATGPLLATVQTTGEEGAFRTTITIPPAPADDHVILATVTSTTGQVFAAPSPFTVTASTPVPAPGPAGGSPPANPAATAPGRATTGGNSSGASPPGPGSQSQSVAGAPAAAVPGQAIQQGGSEAGGTVTQFGGREVFAGSLATDAIPGGSAAAGGSASPSAGTEAGAVGLLSERTANSDLWGGFSSASLPPGTTGVPGGAADPSRALTFGMILLGAGLVALFAGFGIADVRRRRRATARAGGEHPQS